jgi:hypothetical protein
MNVAANPLFLEVIDRSVVEILFEHPKDRAASDITRDLGAIQSRSSGMT